MEPKPDLKLFGLWSSPYVFRAKMALKLKGLEYEYIEEDLYNNIKSPDLLRHNPVYKRVPVLVHDGRPLSESAVILEYIDEVWPDVYPLFPKDPYERGVVRFWHYFDVDKLDVFLLRILRTAGEEQNAAVEEFRGNLKRVEDEMRDGFFKGRRFFGGDRIGALDILFGCMAVWFVTVGEEKLSDHKPVDPEAFPHYWAWFQDFSQQEVVKEIVPDMKKLADIYRAIRVGSLPKPH